MLIILRLAVLLHKHPHELLDSVVKERWLSLSSQPRRAFYSSLIFRQAIFRSLFRRSSFYSTTCIHLFSRGLWSLENFMLVLIVKPPTVFTIGGFGVGAWRWPTLTWGNPTLPSAMHRFTTEFGMGSGGSNALWSSSDSAGMSRLGAIPNWVCDVLVCSFANFRLLQSS